MKKIEKKYIFPFFKNLLLDYMDILKIRIRILKIGIKKGANLGKLAI